MPSILNTSLVSLSLSTKRYGSTFSERKSEREKLERLSEQQRETGGGGGWSVSHFYCSTSPMFSFGRERKQNGSSEGLDIKSSTSTFCKNILLMNITWRYLSRYCFSCISTPSPPHYIRFDRRGGGRSLRTGPVLAQDVQYENPHVCSSFTRSALPSTPSHASTHVCRVATCTSHCQPVLSQHSAAPWESWMSPPSVDIEDL